MSNNFSCRKYFRNRAKFSSAAHKHVCGLAAEGVDRDASIEDLDGEGRATRIVGCTVHDPVRAAPELHVRLESVTPLPDVSERDLKDLAYEYTSSTSWITERRITVAQKLDDPRIPNFEVTGTSHCGKTADLH